MKQKKPVLFNKIGRDILKKELMKEPFDRVTASFYIYHPIQNPQQFRDELFIAWDKLNVFGRIYIATEGVNAQLSVPEQYWKLFLESMNSFSILKNISIKKAIQDGNSFFKLTIKVREELVAYGVHQDTYNMDLVGNHLTAEEYNQALEKPDTIIVDMRNYYESEIGKFETAIVPDVEISKELLPEVKRILKGKEEEKILLYCTGGIRCEKTSAFLKDKGFKDVNQLEGGVINYVHQVKTKKLETKFIGENFVFDGRRGETVTDDLLGTCMNCETATNDYTDCNNKACHVMFLQCEACGKKMDGCCSAVCKEISSLPAEVQKEMRRGRKTKFAEKAC